MCLWGWSAKVREEKPYKKADSELHFMSLPALWCSPHITSQEIEPQCET